MLTRKFKRIQLACRAMVMSGNQNFDALTENISLNGLFIPTKCLIPVGRMAVITLNLPCASRSSTLTLDGEVVRRDARGLAFKFKSLNHDTFSQLRTVLCRKPRYC